MAQQVPLHIKSGLPFSRTIIATLPTGRAWWTLASEFEALSQIREAEDYASLLLLDLTSFLTITFDTVDTVTIQLIMTGADTRKLTKNGFYDVVLSNPLALDDRAIQIVGGPVYRTAVVTGDTEEINL